MSWELVDGAMWRRLRQTPQLFMQNFLGHPKIFGFSSGERQQ